MSLNILRKILPVALKQYMKQLLGLPMARIHPDWCILEKIGPIETEHTVLDVGARNGWFFQCWQKWCPLVKVYAFEPDVAAYQRLTERFKLDTKVTLSDYGIGAKESSETFYHLSESEVSSSFLPHDSKIWDEIKYQTGEVDKRQVKVTTLDLYAQKNAIQDIYLIKMDIQGYELKALEGSVNVLKNTSYVLVESAIQPLYEGAATFGQVHEFMQKNNFHLIDFRSWHQGNNKLIEADLLFRHDDLLPEVSDPDAPRCYIGSAA